MRTQINYEPTLLETISGKLEHLDKPDSFYQYLEARSEFIPHKVNPTSFLQGLFSLKHNEKIKIVRDNGKNPADYYMWPDQSFDFYSPKGLWFLPQPVNKKGVVLNYKYILLKNNEAPAFEWLKAILFLIPCVTSITHSGKNKFHVLVKFCFRTEHDFIREASRMEAGLRAFGTDICNSMQMTRLPGCFRHLNGSYKEQRLLYFSPSANPLPICEILPRR